uniref:Transmembrane protein 79a n=1 Tax=Fundulus heteroclitus TaxID=8078 RepID=A0A3Q2QKT3_FUNHE
MAAHDGVLVGLNDAAPPPDDSEAESKMSEDGDSVEEERRERTEMSEATSLPYPGDKNKKLLLHQEEDASGSEERDTGISQGGSQDLSEEQSQAEGVVRSTARRRSDEIKLKRNDKGYDSLTDEEEEEERDKEWRSEKPSIGFTPNVTIVRPTTKEHSEENLYPREEAAAEQKVWLEPDADSQYGEDQDDKYYVCEHICGEKLRLVLATVAAGLLFPLLVWAGYELLPFDAPVLESAPLRVLYTLRCSFFAIIPIVLGVVVQGVARLRFSALEPLYQGELVNREVMVHWHYVNESLSLFLFYFLQLAVLASYLYQDMVKLVPLLTIIFVFGRLIYWLCLSLDSSVRAFGFGFSFLPVLVMLGANLYFVCAEQGSVFDVAPPATPPPPRLRWWF